MKFSIKSGNGGFRERIRGRKILCSVSASATTNSVRVSVCQIHIPDTHAFVLTPHRIFLPILLSLKHFPSNPIKSLRRRWGVSREVDCCTEKRLAASGYKHASVRPCVFCRSTLLRVCHSESAHESQTFFGAADIPRNPSPPRRKFLLLFVAFLTLLCYYWSRTKAFGISERLFLLLKYTLTSINN